MREKVEAFRMEGLNVLGRAEAKHRHVLLLELYPRAILARGWTAIQQAKLTVSEARQIVNFFFASFPARVTIFLVAA